MRSIVNRLRSGLPAGPEHVSLRVVERQIQDLIVRDDVVEPPSLTRDTGLMVTVHEAGGLGYAATPDLSPAGVREATTRARRWAQASSRIAAFDTRSMRMPTPSGEWASAVARPWESVPLTERIDRLRRACASIPTNLAEGCGRSGQADFNRFVSIAMGSACETEYLLFLSHDLSLLDSSSHQGLHDGITEIKKMLTSLSKTLTLAAKNKKR